MTYRRLEIKNKKFGMLTALHPIGPNKFGQIVWKFKCECGDTTDAVASAVVGGHTKSCGCHGKARRLESVVKHRLSGHKLYKVWNAMRHRCNNSNDKNFKHYGLRGIKVCAEWLEFINFYDWAISSGWDDGLEIDRRDNDGGYSPENCRIVTRKCNISNKRQLVLSKAGFIGVTITKSGKKFRATYHSKNKAVHVGYYHTALDAAIHRHMALVEVGDDFIIDPKLKGIAYD